MAAPTRGPVAWEERGDKDKMVGGGILLGSPFSTSAQHWEPKQQLDVCPAVPCSPQAVMWDVSEAWKSPQWKGHILSVMLLGCSRSWSRAPLPPSLHLLSSPGQAPKERHFFITSGSVALLGTFPPSGTFEGLLYCWQWTSQEDMIMLTLVPHCGAIIGVNRGTASKAPSLMPVYRRRGICCCISCLWEAPTLFKSICLIGNITIKQIYRYLNRYVSCNLYKIAFQYSLMLKNWGKEASWLQARDKVGLADISFVVMSYRSRLTAKRSEESVEVESDSARVSWEMRWVVMAFCTHKPGGISPPGLPCTVWVRSHLLNL